MDFPTDAAPACFLVDNGSLQPAATRSLRSIAAALSARVGRPVEPVSLLHSGAVPASELDGVTAETLEPAIRARHAAGRRAFRIVPLFFGPSGALTDYLPRRIAGLQATMPDLDVRVARPVADLAADPQDSRLAGLLADHVRSTIRAVRIARPSVVVLVDHGSPQRAVAEVRDHVARQLAETLGPGAVRAVIPASMERREGAEYAFNEPLLERALTEPPCGSGAGDVVLAMLFFSPGRHAGPDGDIASICWAAEARCPGLQVHVTPLVGEHPGLIDILAGRFAEVMT